jgi:hypothetical protein
LVGEGCGAGEDFVGVGDGAGAEDGGDSEGDGVGLLEPDPPDPLDPLDPLDVPGVVGVGVGRPAPELPDADGPACTVGWAFGDAPACACRWCRRAAAWVEAAADVGACVLGVLWLVVWAGAVRANNVTRPTAVTALSWVARQVSLDRRRRPTVRVSPGYSSVMITVGEVMDRGSRYGSPLPWVG